MEVNFLKSKELIYELAIRGQTDVGDTDAKRKVLRGLLHREKHNRSLSVPQNNYAFATDVLEIRESISDIKEVLAKYTGEPGNNCRRLETRLTHLSGRVERLVTDTDEEVATQKELAAEVLVLEGEFASAIKPVSPEVPSAPAGFSTPLRETSTFSHSRHGAAKVYKWGVTFTGLENPDQIFEFLDRIEELRIARGASKVDLLNSAIDIFRDNALLWFRSIKNSIDNWEDLVDLLKKEFLPSHLDFDIWEKIRSRKQSFSEKCAVYIATMENLFSRLQTLPEEKSRLDQIMFNMHSFYLERLALVEVTSIRQLSEVCRKLEEARSRMYPAGQKASKVSVAHPSSSGLSSLHCWNCNQNNHVYYDCVHPRKKFCFGCGRPNTIKSACPACKAKNSVGATPLAVASSSTKRPEVSKDRRERTFHPKGRPTK